MTHPPDGWTAYVKPDSQGLSIVLGYQRGKSFFRRAKLFSQRELWEQQVAPILYATGWTIVHPSGEIDRGATP